MVAVGGRVMVFVLWAVENFTLVKIWVPLCKFLNKFYRFFTKSYKFLITSDKLRKNLRKIP